MQVDQIDIAIPRQEPAKISSGKQPINEGMAPNSRVQEQSEVLNTDCLGDPKSRSAQSPKYEEFKMTNQTVAFVGLGYIGLPTAVVMANSWVDVTGVDVNEANVERINRGEVTIVEPGLEEELKQAIESGNFRATTSQVHAQTLYHRSSNPFHGYL